MKFLLVIFFEVALVKNMSAQADSLSILPKKKIIEGIEINVGASYLYPKALYESALRTQKQKYGYVIAISGITPITRSFDVSTNLSFERKGFKRSETDQYRTFVLTANVNNDYIILSLVPRLIFKKRMVIGFGPYFSVLCNSKRSYYLQLHGAGQPFSPPYEISYSKTDWGYTSVIGYSFLYKKKLLLNIKLINSNGKVNNNNSQVVSILSYSYNNSVSLLVGVTLNK